MSTAIFSRSLYIRASDFQNNGQLAQKWARVNMVNDLKFPKMQFLSSAINLLLPIHEIPCTVHVVSANTVKISDGLKLNPNILLFKNKQ
jgi:hypothetical protein